jgi:GntR family transcriptional regulator
MTKATHPPGVAALKQAPGILYRHVADLLRKRIERGDWPPGGRLPSIESLAGLFGVAVVTIRQALALLEQDRLVERQQGRGTFIAANVREKRWLKLESSWDDLIRMWDRSTPRPIKVRDTVESPMLDPEDGIAAPAYRYMRRVHLADDIPYAVIDLYVDRRLYARNPDQFERKMVIVVLDAMRGVEVRSMRQCLTIGTADLETATLLGIAVGSPVGNVRRVIRDQNDVVIYVGEAVYRGDLVKLERELRRDP